MARINLLPWRAECRVQRQREFYVMLAAAAVAGLLLSFLLWFHYDRQVAGQTERNEFLKAEIAKVQAQNKEIERLDEQKRRLLARKDVIEKLQANRSQMVHLFDSLVRTIPDGVTLTSIKQEGDILTLGGRSGIDLRTLQELAGHSKPELTARYSHRRLYDLAGAVEKMPNILATEKPETEQLRATGTDPVCTQFARTP